MQLELELLGRYCCLMFDHCTLCYMQNLQHTSMDTGTSYEGGIYVEVFQAGLAVYHLLIYRDYPQKCSFLTVGSHLLVHVHFGDLCTRKHLALLYRE